MGGWERFLLNDLLGGGESQSARSKGSPWPGRGGAINSHQEGGKEEDCVEGGGFIMCSWKEKRERNGEALGEKGEKGRHIRLLEKKRGEGGGVVSRGNRHCATRGKGSPSIKGT